MAAYAKERGITRALAAVELYERELDGAIFLCGNAPLALAGVVRLAVEHGVAPALIVGMPVGFVNVVESKKLLDLVTVPFIRLNGRRGGSPLAVATLHAIMEEGLE
ncbi:Cobalt-precorrin-8 methylmutase [bioreactor metagenome]|uniref:Cobalt-precorrin-8 methylmutase n=1 Tax=bioreactor metagenome TaxID=1076179 RepID=A0A645CZT3_9ZZZZ